jgi:hypothetical protein
MRPAAPRLALLTSQIVAAQPLISSIRPVLPRSRAGVKTKTMAPIETKSFDYIVIGGGSGGSGAARRASGCTYWGSTFLPIRECLKRSSSCDITVSPFIFSLDICSRDMSRERQLQFHPKEVITNSPLTDRVWC